MKFITLFAILFPIIIGIGMMAVRPQQKKTRNTVSIVCALLTSAAVFATILLTLKNGADATRIVLLRFSEALKFELRIDGPSMIFGGIISVLWPITVIYAFSYMDHEENLNRFFGFFLVSYGVVAGIAFSANFFTLYFFYELMTLATLPLVMHEMNGKARSAGIKYVVYSMAGAALIFIALVFFINYGKTLDFVPGGILDMGKIAGHEGVLRFIFVLGFFGFGVKAGIFPLHDWLPSASVAPTPVTALLHAVAVVKSGAFGVLRLIYYGFGPSFLLGSGAQAVAVCAASATIVFGSIKALRTGHLKRRLAYSTVANLSYILLAFAVMTPESLTGGLLHMMMHAVIKISLFFCAGAILHHSKLEYIDDMEGLGRKMPITCAVFTFMSLALIGIPPLGGFISKWTIGTASSMLGTWYGVVGACALIVSAIMSMLYMATVIVRFYLPLKDAEKMTDNCREADKKMTVPLIVLVVLLIVLSACSRNLIHFIQPFAALMGGV